VIIRASADTIVVCPPLIITPQEIALLASTIDAAIAEVSAALALH
jgi:adenosylmethionine-8-amino-7-oxononanoate aminotransferase